MIKIPTILAATALVALAGFSASAADYTIRASHAESTESPLHKGWLVFEAFVEGASGGMSPGIIVPPEHGALHPGAIGAEHPGIIGTIRVSVTGMRAIVVTGTVR